MELVIASLAALLAPQEAQLSKSALIDELVQGYADYRQFSGAILVSEEGAVLYQRAFDEVHHNMALIAPGVGFRELSEKAYRQPERFVPNRYTCLAHGVGMSDEYPMIAYRQDWARTGYDGVIQEHMVLCVESYVGETGGEEGVKLEQPVLVTASGCEPLCHYPFEESWLR